VGAIWLLSLPDVLRGAGLEVDEYEGWATRARLTGGYDGVWAVECHHTATFTSPANDMNWMWRNAPERPVGACYLARNGRWTVGAAGATNTSGKGGPLKTSKGTIPLDAANRYVISIEAANNGVGEPWPLVQQISYVKGVAALCKAYGLRFDYPDVHGHFEWTTRKIDPAGESLYASGSNKWNMAAFRSDVAKAATPPPPPIPPTPTQEIEMLALDWKPGTSQWTAFTWTGVELSHVTSGHADNVIRRAGVSRQTVSDLELSGIIASSTTKTNAPSTLSPGDKVVWDGNRR
jgi:hypothetical protein